MLGTEVGAECRVQTLSDRVQGAEYRMPGTEVGW